MSETFIAVLDRIVDGETAVLLLEDGGEVVDERALEVGTVPEDGRHEGAVFDVRVVEGEVLELAYRADLEAERRERLQARFDRLSRRLSDEE